MKNLDCNIKDQCSKDSKFYSWSGLDLTEKSANLGERSEQLENLIETFCNEEVVTGSKYMHNKERSITPDYWNGFFIKIAYPPEINSTENDMKEEFKKAWSSINKLWLKSVNKGEVSQLKFWKEFLHFSYAIQFLSFSQLVQIVIANSVNTFDFKIGH